ncbi:hypothetical protein MUU77_02665 [Pseudoxanthomonas sp. F37]|uniref:hypothetical protein n=1 Tax=Pseudoxanthomonas TaxID=83618 RepID=UPI001FD3DC23|nr:MULTISPECIES: hypothetical protein [Pseudoxanthomonas]UOV04242.1 hypothetical protein MUU75_14040 [Pseudoxanthomonas mexicana]UOV09227.1 hypothetical protein MUU77_02665 [Pseudoxanthomonas sp. F37]
MTTKEKPRKKQTLFAQATSSSLEGILAVKTQEAISEYCLSYPNIRPRRFREKQRQYLDMERHDPAARNAHPVPGIGPH